MVVCGIYMIKNTYNNKVYIGQSKSILTRWKEHKYELKNGRHHNRYLQRAWDKYGEENFHFEIIKECPPKLLDEMEVYYIDVYNSYDRNFGYNLTLGGNGTSTINVVLQFDAFGNYVASFKNGIEASVKTGFNCSAIYGCCCKRLKKVNHFIFVFKHEYDEDQSLDFWLSSNRNTPIEQYDFYGNLIRVWSSCAEVRRELGINPIDCLLHNKKTYKGFIWKRINDSSVQITDEYCANIRNTSGKLQRRCINQIDNNGKIVKTYTSLREITRNHLSRYMVKKCLDGICEYYKDCKWVYADLGVV